MNKRYFQHKRTRNIKVFGPAEAKLVENSISWIEVDKKGVPINRKEAKKAKEAKEAKEAETEKQK